MTTTSSDVAHEEQIFFTLAEIDNQSEEQIFKREEQFRQYAKQWVANVEPPSLKTRVKDFTKTTEASSQMHEYEQSRIST